MGYIISDLDWLSERCYSSVQVPSLHGSASMYSSRPPSLGHLRPPEHSDCNGKGSPSTLGPTHVSLEENTEDENAEEEIALVCLHALLHSLIKQSVDFLEIDKQIKTQVQKVG